MTDPTQSLRNQIAQAHMRLQMAVQFWGEGGMLSEMDKRQLAQIRADMDEMLEGVRPTGKMQAMDAVANATRRVK